MLWIRYKVAILYYYYLITQAIDNYDNFDQTIMGLEVSQTEDPLNQAPQPGMHYGASMEETCTQCFTPLSCN